MTSSGLVSVADVQPAASAAPVCTAISWLGARSGASVAAASRPRHLSTCQPHQDVIGVQDLQCNQLTACAQRRVGRARLAPASTVELLAPTTKMVTH